MSESDTGPAPAIDLRSPGEVSAAFREGAAANLDARCRQGGADVIDAAGEIVATGDLHDNPMHFARVVELARLDSPDESLRRHLTLHEVIHSDRLVSGVDLSHRALARVAALKARFPERIHTLLANHELSQIAGMGVVKDGVRMTEAFNKGIDFVFGADAGAVRLAVEEFIRSMPLALVSGRGTDRGVLFAHSLPAPELMDRFDPGILDRALVEEDYAPRRGSAHLMVWGRNHEPEQLRSLAQAWGVRLFVLGHEKAEAGWFALRPNAVALNSDHERGVAAMMDLANPPHWPPPEGWRFEALGAEAG